MKARSFRGTRACPPWTRCTGAGGASKPDNTEIAANRAGGSNDDKADAAVRFATAVVRERGHVGDADVAALKSAGYDDAQVIEIVLHIAFSTFTNYLYEVAKTDIDFPVAKAPQAA